MTRIKPRHLRAIWIYNYTVYIILHLRYRLP